MESEEQTEPTESQPADDESVEDFKREMEEDPSRAPSDDEGLERQRGG